MLRQKIFNSIVLQNVEWVGPFQIYEAYFKIKQTEKSTKVLWRSSDWDTELSTSCYFFIESNNINLSGRITRIGNIITTKHCESYEFGVFEDVVMWKIISSREIKEMSF